MPKPSLLTTALCCTLWLAAGAARAEEFIDDDGDIAGDPPVTGLQLLQQSYPNGGTLRFYGQINRGFLSFDDGLATRQYNFIDSAASGTRIGVTYDQNIGGWDYLGNIEVQYAPFSTANTNILSPRPTSAQRELGPGNIRRIDNRLSNPRYGFIHFGQGSMASDGAAGIDLSGTAVVSSSSVADIAAAQLFRQSDGTLSTIQMANAFANYSGLGRLVRVRYDTPTVYGFELRTSYGRNLLSTDPAVRELDQYDVALDYFGSFDSFLVSAKTAYAWRGDDTTIFSGSASVRHVPTGLNLTVAAGSQDNGAVTGSYGYIKAGWQGDLIDWGATAVTVEAYSGSDIAGAGFDSSSTAIALVQDINRYNTELWAIWREYNLDSTTTSYDPATALFLGARVRF